MKNWSGDERSEMFEVISFKNDFYSELKSVPVMTSLPLNQDAIHFTCTARHKFQQLWKFEPKSPPQQNRSDGVLT